MLTSVLQTQLLQDLQGPTSTLRVRPSVRNTSGRPLSESLLRSSLWYGPNNNAATRNSRLSANMVSRTSARCGEFSSLCRRSVVLLGRLIPESLETLFKC